VELSAVSTNEGRLLIC